MWAVVIFAVLLPNAYGAPYPFRICRTQSHSTPRFRRGNSRAGGARYALCGKTRNCLRLLSRRGGALASDHGASQGLASLLPSLGLEDKRWLWFCACAVRTVSILAGAPLGLPLMDRLFIAIDPSLRSLNEDLATPFCFPSRWPIRSFPPLIVQTATIAIAAHLQQGRARRSLRRSSWLVLRAA